jgi:hypothetical protein
VIGIVNRWLMKLQKDPDGKKGHKERVRLRRLLGIGRENQSRKKRVTGKRFDLFEED